MGKKIFAILRRKKMLLIWSYAESLHANYIIYRPLIAFADSNIADNLAFLLLLLQLTELANYQECEPVCQYTEFSVETNFKLFRWPKL